LADHPGVFVRAEWEATLNGTMAQVNTGQLAIGVKFQPIFSLRLFA